MFVLIMVSWIGGYAAGYVTVTQQFSSEATCETARQAWLNMTKDASKSFIKAECVKA